MRAFLVCGVLVSTGAVMAIEQEATAQAKITTSGRVLPSAEQLAKERAEQERLEAEQVEAERLEAEKVRENAHGQEEAEETEEVEMPPDALDPTEDGGRLNIACVGAGAANKTSTSIVSGWTGYGSGFGATAVGQRSQGFADEVRVRFTKDDPRIRMPRTMLPTIRGGKNGWFKLKNVKYGKDEITASIALNTFSNPKLRLDRFTGSISISGKAGDYTGQCQKFEPEKTRKAF